MLLGRSAHDGMFVRFYNLEDLGLLLLCLPKSEHGDLIDQMQMILVSLYFTRMERAVDATSDS